MIINVLFMCSSNRDYRMTSRMQSFTFLTLLMTNSVIFKSWGMDTNKRNASITLPTSTHQVLTPAIKGQLLTSVSKEWKNGLQVQIIEAISKRLNIKVRIVHTPFARRLMLMEKGKLDFVVGIQRTNKRERYIHYISPPYKKTSDKAFFVLKGNKAIIKKYSDLYNLTIGTKIHSKYFSKFDNDIKIKKIAVSNLKQNFNMLLIKRVDAVIYSVSAGLNKVRDMKISDQLEIAEYFNPGEKLIYLGISKKSRLLKYVAQIEIIINEMVLNGEFEQIIHEYYSSYKSEPPENIKLK